MDKQANISNNNIFRYNTFIDSTFIKYINKITCSSISNKNIKELTLHRKYMYKYKNTCDKLILSNNMLKHASNNNISLHASNNNISLNSSKDSKRKKIFVLLSICTFMILLSL